MIPQALDTASTARPTLPVKTPTIARNTPATKALMLSQTNVVISKMLFHTSENISVMGAKNVVTASIIPVQIPDRNSVIPVQVVVVVSITPVQMPAKKSEIDVHTEIAVSEIEVQALDNASAIEFPALTKKSTILSHIAVTASRNPSFVFHRTTIIPIKAPITAMTIPIGPKNPMIAPIAAAINLKPAATAGNKEDNPPSKDPAVCIAVPNLPIKASSFPPTKSTGPKAAATPPKTIIKLRTPSSIPDKASKKPLKASIAFSIYGASFSPIASDKLTIWFHNI